ncbi:kelch repeat protein [Cooperia oncophora]
MSTPREDVRVAVLNNLLYAVGGYSKDRGGFLRSVERLDPRVGRWEDVCPMLQGRYRFGTAVFDGHLYVAGGERSEESVQSYSPLTNKWIELPAMKMNSRTERLAVVNGKFYALAGFGCETVHVFDSEMNEWKLHSYLNEERCGADVAVLQVP